MSNLELGTFVHSQIEPILVRANLADQPAYQIGSRGGNRIRIVINTRRHATPLPPRSPGKPLAHTCVKSKRPACHQKRFHRGPAPGE